MPRWFTYILQCSDKTFYTGSTNDLSRRLLAHGSGKGARYTRSRRPVHLAWSQAAAGRSAAQRREAWIKSLPREKKTKLVRTAARIR